MQFRIYKSGQAYYTRLYSALGAFAVVAIGAMLLYDQLRVFNNLWLQTLAPVGVCVAAGLGLYWMSNRAGVADFLISAEGEIKKVNWSSRREVTVSTSVVLIVVIVMALLLWCMDLVYTFLAQEVFNLDNLTPRG